MRWGGRGLRGLRGLLGLSVSTRNPDEAGAGPKPVLQEHRGEAVGRAGGRGSALQSRKGAGPEAGGLGSSSDSAPAVLLPSPSLCSLGQSLTRARFPLLPNGTVPGWLRKRARHQGRAGERLDKAQLPERSPSHRSSCHHTAGQDLARTTQPRFLKTTVSKSFL